MDSLTPYISSVTLSVKGNRYSVSDNSDWFDRENNVMNLLERISHFERDARL